MGTYASILPDEPEIMTLAQLESHSLPTCDFLRPPALKIGNSILKDVLDPDTTIVDIRSGLYNPRTAGIYALNYHFDITPDGAAPVEAYIVATGVIGTAVTGTVRFYPENKRTWIAEQANKAQEHAPALDVSQAQKVPLKPGVLYLLPKFCVHAASQEVNLYGKNFFRYKNMHQN